MTHDERLRVIAMRAELLYLERRYAWARRVAALFRRRREELEARYAVH